MSNRLLSLHCDDLSLTVVVMDFHGVIDRELLSAFFTRIFPVTMFHREVMTKRAVNLERSVTLLTLVF